MSDEGPRPVPLRLVCLTGASVESPSEVDVPATAAGQPPVPRPPPAVTPPAPQPPMSDQERFELLVANDVEHERQLLYRALVVVELIGALIVAREMLLWWTLG